MSEKTERTEIDFSNQLRLDNNSKHIEDSIFRWLDMIASEVADDKQDPIGSIIVLGDFEKFGPKVDGMVQMKPKQNPIESYMPVDREDGGGWIKEFSPSPYDGAIIVNKTGQIVGAGVYLVVDNPTLDVPDDCGTRHKAAASFSLRNDIISVLTISEETNTVRMWKDGQVEKTHKTDSETKNGEER